MNDTKTCARCKQTKELLNFRKLKRDGDYYSSYCHECEIEISKTYHQQHREEMLLHNKEYRNKNKDKLKLKRKQYCLEHKDEIKAKQKDYYEQNKEILSQSNRDYYQIHKIQIYKRHKEYWRNDAQFRVRKNLNTKLRGLFKFPGKKKGYSLLKYINCSLDDLIVYLESKFTAGMSWDNYGKWNIDHRIPCVVFNLFEENDIRKCFDYRNLKPEWGWNNFSKGDILPDGRRARSLSPEERAEFVRTFDFEAFYGVMDFIKTN